MKQLFILLCILSLSTVFGQNSKGGPGIELIIPNCTGEESPTIPHWYYSPYKVTLPCQAINVGIGIVDPQYELDVKKTGRFTRVIAKKIQVGVPYDNSIPLTSNAVLNVVSPSDYGNILSLSKKTINSTTGDIIFTVDAQGAVKINNKSNGAPFTVKAYNGNKILQLENNGLLRARRIRVDSDNWADYVFVNGYKLLPLQEVAQFIKQNGHLPNIPSAQFLKQYGIDVNEMLMLQMEKIEELTLYTIDQNNIIETLTSKLEKLEKEMAEIKALLKNN